jgi:hypothetical protein
MAFTFTPLVNSVFGNQRVLVGTVAADGASGAVSFGLSTLTGVSWSAKSMATAIAKVKINALAAATAAVGSLSFDAVAAGDDIHVTVYGR